ncbi:MAG: hypothetical protein ACFFD4_20185 [Candidatus Odinarchaeota archaeon]
MVEYKCNVCGHTMTGEQYAAECGTEITRIKKLGNPVHCGQTMVEIVDDY